jgi:hypothetical protein
MITARELSRGQENPKPHARDLPQPPTKSAETGEHLVSHPGVDKVAFHRLDAAAASPRSAANSSGIQRSTIDTAEHYRCTK